MATTSVETESVPAPLLAPKSHRTVRHPPKLSLGELTPNNVGTLRKLHSVLFPVRYSDKFYTDVLDPRLEDFCKLVYYNDLPVGAVCCRLEAPTQPTGPAPKSSHTNSSSEAHKLYIMTLGVLAPYRRQGLATLLISHVLKAASATHVTPPTTSTTTTTSSTTSGTTSTTASKTTSSSTATGSASHKKGKKNATASASATNGTSKSSSATHGGSLVNSQTATTSGNSSATTTVGPIPPLQKAYVHVQKGNDEAKAFYEGFGFTLEGEVEEYYKRVEQRAAWILGKSIEAPSSPSESTAAA